MQLLELNNGTISPIKGIFRKKNKETILKCLEFNNPSVITLKANDMPTLTQGKNPNFMIISDAHIQINNQTLKAVKNRNRNSKIIMLGFFIEIEKNQEITPQVNLKNKFIADKVYQVKIMPSKRSSTGYAIWGFALLVPGHTFHCEGFKECKLLWSIKNENGFAKIHTKNIE